MFMNPFRKKDLERRRRSSNQFQQKEDTAKVINIRLKVTAVVILLVFGIFSVRLAQLQLFDNASYQQKLIAFTAKKQTFSPPRGAIKDKNGIVLVQSVMSLTIMYFPPETITEQEEWDLADKFVTDLNYVPSTELLDRETKDMHILYMAQVKKDNLNSLLTKDELKKANEGTLKSSEVYDIKLERISVPDLALDEHTLKVYQVKMNMDKSPNNEYKTVVEGASQEQLAYLTEHSSDFKGFKGFTSDWKREITPEGERLKAVLGSISTQTQGVPAEEKDYYLAQGYAMNDRVGISGLEKEYETLLSGTKSTYNISYDENGLAVLTQETAGKKGYDIELNIDIKFVEHMDEFLKAKLADPGSNAMRTNFNELYFAAMDPDTGALLTLNGVNRRDGDIHLNPEGVYLDPDRVGSAVKVATLYMGLDQGVIQPDTVIFDGMMDLRGTDPMKSHTSLQRNISTVEAIQKSSNVYMWDIAIRLGGSSYTPGMTLSVKDGTFDLMRSYYNMFGLGVATGIDVPDEEIGFMGSTVDRGKTLHLAIGQYDTYSTMQLTQYASTIANNGYRMQPSLFKQATEVNDPSTIVYLQKANILSSLKGNTEFLKKGQEGMDMCVNADNGAYCVGTLKKAGDDTGVRVAAKTGTAENDVTVNGESVTTSNQTQVGYAPYDKPQIAFACMATNAADGTSTPPNICADVNAEAIRYYFKK